MHSGVRMFRRYEVSTNTCGKMSGSFTDIASVMPGKENLCANRERSSHRIGCFTVNREPILEVEKTNLRFLQYRDFL